MSAFKVGLADIFDAIKRTPLALSLAFDDTMYRFERTYLGPLWIPVANLIMIAGLTYVFGAIFQADIKTYIVYLAAGLMVWSYIAGVLTSGPNYFVMSQDVLESFSLPWSLQVLRYLTGHLLIFLIHAVIWVVLALVVQHPITWYTAMALVGLAILIVTGFGLGLILASLGIRFRDLQHAIESVMMFLFLLTPIFWRSSDLPFERPAVTEFNPFFHLIEIVRGPLLGVEVTLQSWIISLVIAGVSLFAGAIVFAANRPRILLWA